MPLNCLQSLTLSIPKSPDLMQRLNRKPSDNASIHPDDRGYNAASDSLHMIIYGPRVSTLTRTSFDH